MTSNQDTRGDNKGFVENHSTIVRLQRRADAIRRRMSIDIVGVSVREVGCGTGRLSYMFADDPRVTHLTP